MPKKLYVGNLPRSFGSSDLEGLFTTYGTVRAAEVITDRMTGQSRGFGFVEMENQQAMQEAIQALNGSTVQGHALTVSEARERTPRGGGGRPGGGGGGGSRPRGGYGGGGRRY